MRETVEPRSRSLLRSVSPALLGAAAFATVLLLMLLDGVRVQRQEELESVEFGMPLDWVTQDQSLDPPLPYDTSFLSPWEHVTSVDFLPLIVDVVLVGLLLAVGWRLVRALGR